MIGKSRPFRFLWVLGVLLLVGMLIGARFILNGHSVDSDAKGAELDPNVFAQGFTDVVSTRSTGLFRGERPTTLEGISVLMPGQPGRVIWVIKEGAEVKQGDVLLRLDARRAIAQRDQASAQYEAAQKMEAQAAMLEQQHEHLIKQQRSALEVAKLSKISAEQNLEIAKLAEKPGAGGSKLHTKLAENELKKAEQSILAETEKLNALTLLQPKVKLAEARANKEAADARLRESRLAVEECEVRAPSDGTVMRVQIGIHELLNPQAVKLPPIQFCPKGKLVVRAEVLQEWASRVKVGQEVVIEDDSRAGQQWKGRVYYTAGFMTHKRHIMNEPFIFNDVRTMEVKIELLPGQQPLLVGQQVRAIIKTGK